METQITSPIKEYYVGGDDGDHFKLWTELYPSQEVPDYSTTCTDCQEVIDTQVYLETEDQRRRVVGECCYNKYPPKRNAKNNDQKLTKVNNTSQKIEKSPESELNPNTHFDDGVRKGLSFEYVLNNEPGYLKYITSKPIEGKCYRNAIRYYQEHISEVKPFFEFGKYRGRTYESVFKENNSYFSYLQTKESTNPRYKEALEWYIANSEKVVTRNIVQIGKWKGTTFEEVFEKAPDYLSWVVNNINDEKSPLYPLVEWIKENHIELKSPTKKSNNTTKTPVISSDGSVANYGKYNGKTVDEIWELDPDYFRFIARKGSLSGNSETFNRRAIQFYIEKMGWTIDDSITFDSGKYSGQNVVEVFNGNKDYFDWILTSYTGKGETMIKAGIWFRLKEN